MTDLPTPHGKNVDQVPRADKVRGMFDIIASRYDLANDALSLGLHRGWRKKLIRSLKLEPGHQILDAATGTGDLAIVEQTIAGESGLTVGIDLSVKMMEGAKSKCLAANVNPSFLQANMLDLPMGDNTFDAVSVAFGIRNVEDPGAAMAEIMRVLKPGGRFAVLELGVPRNPVMRTLYRASSTVTVPMVGLLTTGKMGAYSYLRASSHLFPCGEAFKEIVRDACTVENLVGTALTFGVVYLYTGIKPGA